MGDRRRTKRMESPKIFIFCEYAALSPFPWLTISVCAEECIVDIAIVTATIL
jgi:hypothetical protein